MYRGGRQGQVPAGCWVCVSQPFLMESLWNSSLGPSHKPQKEPSAPAGSPWQHPETGSQLCLPALVLRCQQWGIEGNFFISSVKLFLEHILVSDSSGPQPTGDLNSLQGLGCLNWVTIHCFQTILLTVVYLCLNKLQPVSTVLELFHYSNITLVYFSDLILKQIRHWKFVYYS